MLVINLDTGICSVNLITYLRALRSLRRPYKKLRVMILDHKQDMVEKITLDMKLSENERLKSQSTELSSISLCYLSSPSVSQVWFSLVICVHHNDLLRSRLSAPQPINDLVISECDGKRSSKRKTYPDLLLNDVNFICNTSKNKKGVTKKRKADTDDHTLVTLGELMGNKEE